VNDTPQYNAANPGNTIDGAHIIGFALFFLRSDDGKGAVCAEYVGPANQGSLYAGPTANPSQYYAAQLVK